MANAWNIQLAKQAGEYLVAGELCRRNYLAATFSGGIRDYDILAINESKRTFTVQVKTILGGTFQVGNAGKFLEINDTDGHQTVIRPHEQRIADVWVFVYLKPTADPRYFVAPASTVQDLIFEGYSRNLRKHGHHRPVNPHSQHHAITFEELKKFEDDWAAIDRLIDDPYLDLSKTSSKSTPKGMQWTEPPHLTVTPLKWSRAGRNS